MTKKPITFWLLLGSLYTTQYLGLSFFSVAMVAIYALCLLLTFLGATQDIAVNGIQTAGA